MVKTLIVDDHSVVRQGLEAFLLEDEGIEVIGSAQDGKEAVQKVRELRPEVVLMDIFMPKMDGLEAATLLKRELPKTKIIMLTGKLDVDTVNQVIRSRMDGFILKTIDQKSLCQTVKAATCNQFLMSPEIASLLADPAKRIRSLHTLTIREAEVLKFVARGKANKEIAREMGLSEGTIKSHVSKILAKLSLQSRPQLALYATQEKLI